MYQTGVANTYRRATRHTTTEQAILDAFWPLVVLPAFVIALASVATADDAQPTNIVIILTDDLEATLGPSRSAPTPGPMCLAIVWGGG